MFNVLLPIDENEKRATEAVDVFRSLPIEPTEVASIVFNVSEETEQPHMAEIESVRDAEENGLVPDTVGQAVDRLEADGFTVDERWTVGNPSDEIVDLARDEDVDHIVMSGRKQSPSKKVVFGSVAQEVLLHADRPVTITMSE